MNLYIWVDENGEWCITHLPPKESGNNSLLLALPPGVSPCFIDLAKGEELTVRVQ